MEKKISAKSKSKTHPSEQENEKSSKSKNEQEPTKETTSSPSQPQQQNKNKNKKRKNNNNEKKAKPNLQRNSANREHKQDEINKVHEQLNFTPKKDREESNFHRTGPASNSSDYQRRGEFRNHHQQRHAEQRRFVQWREERRFMQW